MKYAVLCATLITGLLCADDTALIQDVQDRIKASNYQIIDADALKDYPFEEAFIDLSKQVSPQIIVRCPKGSTLPLDFSVKGNTVSVPKVTCELKIEKDIYLAFVEDSLFLSSDLQDWKVFCDFWTGSCSFGAMIDDGQLITDFGFEVDQ